MTESALIADASVVTSFVRAVDACVSGEIDGEAKIHWTDDGLSVKAVDPSNVLMVATQLDADRCESYDLADEQTIGVDVAGLMDVLEIPSADDVLELTLDHDTHGVTIAGPGFDYAFHTLDPTTVRQEPDLPDLDFAIDVELAHADVKRIVGGADMLTDTVTLGSDGESFTAIADGDTDDLTFSLGEDDIDIETLSDDESVYSIGYCKRMLKGLSGDVRVRIAGTEFPMRIDSDEPNGETTYLLAPRVNTS